VVVETVHMNNKAEMDKEIHMVVIVDIKTFHYLHDIMKYMYGFNSTINSLLHLRPEGVVLVNQI
jgi:hypothetical protein